MSQLNVDTIKDRGGADQPDIIGAAKAWVNYDQNTPEVLGSFNVDSVTDDATGRFTVNFTNNMPDNDYAVSGVAQGLNNLVGISVYAASAGLSPLTVSSVQLQARADTGSVLDSVFGVTVHGN